MEIKKIGGEGMTGIEQMKSNKEDDRQIFSQQLYEGGEKKLELESDR